MTIADENMLDDLWIETWSRLSKHGIVNMTICIHVPKDMMTNLEHSRKNDNFGI